MNIRADNLGVIVKDLPILYSNTGYFNFKNSWKANEFIGVEFEVEGYNLPPSKAFRYHWDVKMDGSLRILEDTDTGVGGAHEYVLKKPVSPGYFKTMSFPYLMKKINQYEAVPKWSSRCSVHVHVGVHDLYVYQVFIFIGLYYLFEDLFFDLIGPDRDGNLFCLSANTADSIVDVLTEIAISGHLGGKLSIEGMKYSAANLQAIGKYGTVEFRAMEGNLDRERIFTWIDILCALKEYAKSVTPQQVGQLLSTMSMSGVVEMFKEIMGGGDSSGYQYVFKTFKGNTDQMRKIIYCGIGKVQRLFYEPEWHKIIPRVIPVNHKEEEKPSPLKEFWEGAPSITANLTTNFD